MNKKAVELSLKLFNAIPAGISKEVDLKSAIKYGVVIDENASYATGLIIDYFKKNKLNGKQLNATFHKSWKVIKDSSREELLIHQILHYFTTYGTNFTSDFIYIPAEKLDIPNVKNIQLKVIKGLDKSEIITKALDMLSTGVALDESTIDDLLELLSELKHKFDNVDGIKNKEALVRIVSKTGVYPSTPTEFLRFLVYLSTESTLLIKSKSAINLIKAKKLNIVFHLKNFGFEKCATIFNRFKPIWLAFKSNKDNVSAINRISKLSKTLHKTLPIDVLNTVTSVKYKKSEIKEALKSANSFRKIRLLNALNTRLNNAEYFLYRVRNGKSFVKDSGSIHDTKYLKKIFKVVYNDLLESLDVKGKRVKYPSNIDYSLPSSEKMFIGNIPAGTKIKAEKLVSGVYWENSWGATDLDLSALSLGGKVGWNASYKSDGLMYSGDMTDARNGATELLYSNGKVSGPSISVLNIFRGEVGCKIKIIIGNATGIKKNYMFNPNELILELETEMKSKQQILGIILPEKKDEMSFTIVNTGFGNISVSGSYGHSDNAREALFYQYSNPISFKKLLIKAGAELVSDGDFDIDLMPTNLQKDSLLNLFEN